MEIYRPENFGNMNTIPCLLKVTDLQGNDASSSIISLSFSWYYDMRWNHRYFNGCFTGGTVVHLNMKAGTYKISVYTPLSMQDSYAGVVGDGDWLSDDFIYKVGSPALKVIFVSPVANDNGFYVGKWHIDYKAPKFYKYTKPLRQ